MATIIVRDKILSGNLGDAFENQTIAANELALFTENYWTRELQDIKNEGHKIIVEVESVRASGCKSDVTIFTPDGDFELESRVTQTLTDPNIIFDKFCNQ